MNDPMALVHEAHFAMLCEVDRVCRKYGIRYYLVYGAAIGAVRGQDFVPWDDDVDITMYRKDFERFLTAFRSDHGDRFNMIEYGAHPQFYDFMVKIADMKYEYHLNDKKAEDFYERRYSHPTMDIFVLDDPWKHYGLQLLLLRVLYALAMGHRPEVDVSAFHGIQAIGARVLPALGKLIPMRVIARWYDKVSSTGRPDDFLFISNEVQDPPYFGMKHKKSWYAQTVDITLRGRQFPAPGELDDFLRAFYGDYMQLPPEDQRQPKHLDLTVAGE